MGLCGAIIPIGTIGSNSVAPEATGGADGVLRIWEKRSWEDGKAPSRDVVYGSMFDGLMMFYIYSYIYIYLYVLIWSIFIYFHICPTNALIMVTLYGFMRFYMSMH